ncbi:dihydrofolate reductase [Pontixanthobacter aestiaquae]|uniref:Dihydrofolate reductase n=1 Tax=Pontixanthobacter aestiaquae TaxID=1509367 RepID=A0A844Z422_9SPHN|nr:dihydrofolate reductase [Pontixanthobacter aestiaquae]MDN3646993.1 dihydrofolate reductase [Pontixanthobacter aestiaquae]MXO82026.1 dihydrofolate reductase [Pontixanthobacter aestiaquae]
MIYARASNGVIGKDGTMPWHIPADLKRFKRLTMGHAMIMGRKTFESFPSPLPGRRHIVLTRDTEWKAEGAEPAHSQAEARMLAGSEPVAIVGGAEIYRLFAKDAERIEMTQIHVEYAGDTVMDAPEAPWFAAEREDHPAQNGCPAFSFLTFLREPA